MKRLLWTAAIFVASTGAALASEVEGAAEHAGGHAGAGHPWHIDLFNIGGDHPNGLFWSLLNFGILLVLLRKLFGKSLKTFLQTRHSTIKEALEEGARLRKEAEQKLAEYGAKIAGVDAEVDALVASIRQSAEEEKARILANAEAQAEAMKKDAEDRIAAEIERSRRTLEREVVDAAIAAAEHILRTKARPDDHQRMADAFIASLTGAPAPKPPTPSTPPTTPTTPGDVDDSW